MSLEQGRVGAGLGGHRQRWQPRQLTLRLRFCIYLVGLDLACLVAAFVTAAALHGAPIMDARMNAVLGMLVPVYVFTAWNAHAYSVLLIRDRYRAVARGVKALALSVGFLILAAFWLKASAGFSRLTLTLGAADGAVLLAVARYLFARHAIALIGGNSLGVVLLCDGDVIVPDHGEFSVMMAADAGFDPHAHDPAMYDRLAKVLECADRVVVACPADRRLAWSSVLRGANIQSEIVVPELAALRPLGVGRHGDLSTLIVSNGPLGVRDRFIKRIFDLGVASGALVMLSPVLAVVAILIRVDTPGPVFFRQTRIGRGNRMFRVFKFRSMSVAAADGDGARSTARDDDRITAVGRFIRRTSIDELPQLLNVIRGDMSLVGPRPHALGSRAADKLFWEVDTRYWHRHAAKPGMTGLAQVRGYRGATERECDLLDRLLADLEYLDRWSIWKDIKILLQTFHVVLHQNAY